MKTQSENVVDAEDEISPEAQQKMLLSDPAKRKAVLDAIKEVSASMTKIGVEKDHIKAVINSVSDGFDIPKPMIRKVAVLYHKQNVKDFDNQHAAIKELYKRITT